MVQATLIVFAIYFVVVYLVIFVSYIRKKALFRSLKNSTLTVGAKGSGKDLLTQEIVNCNKKRNWISVNIKYKENMPVIRLRDLENGLSYDDFINDRVPPQLKRDELEGSTLIISDSGIYLPSHEDSKLTKTYKFLPIFVALSRQLYNMPIFANTQKYGRLWLKYREQFDNYILTKRTFNLFFLPILSKYLIIRCYYYDKSESLEQGLLPFGKLGLVSNSNMIYTSNAAALKKQYQATNGKIQSYLIFVKKKNIYYDTRHFHNVVFGYKYVNDKKKKKKFNIIAFFGLNVKRGFSCVLHPKKALVSIKSKFKKKIEYDDHVL